ncbi:hypothetical protein HYFRA_00010272 [Hymenoscyphus fraxineus]|uniref:Zn(2)-C6 fungal-type domain-containing protein n=1 Tax=Hymenoscyphus fraxineus TaxID=746836 RepID=A0A9N9KZG4_9HELO|nr:hypothetical protein HYFRA_00010272 [Hymenoscyphus fraxineus]
MEGTSSNTTHSRRVPLEKRKRTETSCDKCKTRKQKCDRIAGKERCRYCEIHGIQCQTTQLRKKRLYGSAESLGGRLILLESLVKGLVPEADLSSNDEMQRLGKSLGIPLPVVEETTSGQSNGEGENSANAKAATRDDEDDGLPLLPDQQGHVQYIGPSSSFSFHLHLRRLIGNNPAREFEMFGKNAVSEDDEPGDRRGSLMSDYPSPSDAVGDIDGPVLDSLIDAYFDLIHSDFPVLHEASFRETYEMWSRSESSTDPAWLCGLFCVFILARRVSTITIPLEAEKKWWRHVQTLLPTVFFTSNLYTVQTLMLAALHLHNTSHRDACWNITGTAVRIAFAIGLHRDHVKHNQSPLGRELRKQLWWTLYAFEHMQVSSYDRPSAIAYTLSIVSPPNERIVGVAGHCPQDFMKWSQRLVLLLGSACRALNPTGAGASTVEETHSGPLSPAAHCLRDLDKWREALPAHLRLEVTDSLAPSSQRPLLLLHVQYFYIRVLIARAALLHRATNLSNHALAPLSQNLLTISEICIDSGRSLACIMRKLDEIHHFNAVTWWDMFYTVAASLVLVLDVICQVKQDKPQHPADSLKLLRDLATLTDRQLQNPKVPGSMRTWGVIVVEVSSKVEQFVAMTLSRTSGDAHSMAASHESMLTSNEALVHSSAVHKATYAHFNSTRENAPQFWTFAEDSDGHLQDWCWDDIGAMLRGDNSTA